MIAGQGQAFRVGDTDVIYLPLGWSPFPPTGHDRPAVLSYTLETAWVALQEHAGFTLAANGFESFEERALRLHRESHARKAALDRAASSRYARLIVQHALRYPRRAAAASQLRARHTRGTRRSRPSSRARRRLRRA